MTLTKTLGIAVLVCSFLISSAQKIVDVNLNSGGVVARLPLATLQTGNIRYDVSLVYANNGIRVDNACGIAGIGWEFDGISKVSRQVMGLPDEYQGTSPDNRRGWIRGIAALALKTLSFSGDGDPATCTDEYTDWTTLNSFVADQDTEPDIFYASIPGATIKFYFDNDGAIRYENFSDYKIGYVLDPTGIVSFTLTDPRGNIYQFTKRSSVVRSISEDQTTSPYLARIRSLYRDEVRYTGAWYLTSISDIHGNTMDFKYSPLTLGNALRDKNYEAVPSLEYKIGVKSSPFAMQSMNVFSYASELTTHFLSYITTNRKDSLVITSGSFAYSTNPLLQSVSHYVNSSELIRNFDFTYTSDEYDLALIGKPAQERFFLKKVEEKSGAETNRRYSFEYYGASKAHIVFAYRGSPYQDFWGFYNANGDTSPFPEVHVYPDLPASERYRLYPINPAVYNGTHYVLAGSNRTVNPETIIHDALKKVTYPHGGYTTVFYEPSTYYDPVAQQDYPGGGIRVQRLLTHDGISHTNDQNVLYEYTQNSHSSGVLINRPVFAFPIIYQPNLHKTYEEVTASYTAAQVWDLMTARVNMDMAPGDNSVHYKRVVVRPSTGGEIEYQYDIPGTYGDMSAGNNEWTATTLKVARNNNGTGSCDAVGLLSSFVGQPYAFPYFQNPNYEFSRGLLKEKISRNAAGQIINRTVNTYSRKYRSGSLFRIKALGLEQHPAYRLGAIPHIQSDLFVYGQYDVMTGITPVLTEQHNFEIDPADPLRMLETTQFFSYGSGNHSRLTENRSTASDGFEYTTRIKYADDYVISLANKDHSTAMLARLVEKNVVTPVEKITLRNAVGTSSFQIQNAALTRFSDFSTSGVMPLNHSSLDLSSPLAENLFTPSYIDNTGAQSIFVPDGAYKVVGEYLAYSAKGSLLASRGRELLKTGILLDQVRSLPVFSVHGADPTECIFSDFDCHTGNGFSKVFITPPLSTPLTYDAGRNIGKSLKLQPGLGYGIESPFVKTSNIYVLSYWAKTCAESNAVTADGTFTAKIYNGSTLLGTIHLDFDNPSAWKHYQKPIDISSYSGNLSIRIQSGINDLCVDDVAFYPGDASVSSTQYDSKNRVRMVTDGKGISTYFEYDAFGRLITVRDHNQKIKETVTYNTQN